MSGSITQPSTFSVRDTSEVFNPNTEKVTITGSVDLSGINQGGGFYIGLIDKKGYDANGGDWGWAGGAYAFFSKASDGNYRIGPSDGNLGGEIIQTFLATTDPTWDFTLEIYDGNIWLTLGNLLLTDTYGEIKRNNRKNYSPVNYAEFAEGAYLGIDAYNGTLRYDINATQPSSRVPDAGSTGLMLIASLGTLAFVARRFTYPKFCFTS